MNGWMDVWVVVNVKRVARLCDWPKDRQKNSATVQLAHASDRAHWEGLREIAKELERERESVCITARARAHTHTHTHTHTQSHRSCALASRVGSSSLSLSRGSRASRCPVRVGTDQEQTLLLKPPPHQCQRLQPPFPLHGTQQRRRIGRARPFHPVG
jgi:hypothetical protein